MRSQKIVQFPHSKNQLHRLLQTSAIALLVLGGASGIYWQGVHLPGQRSQEIQTQLQTLTESVEELQALVQGNQANKDTQQRTDQPVKVVTSQPQSYWLSVSGSEVTLSPQPLSLATDTDIETALTAAFETLLAGPKAEAKDYTTIPEGTQLLSLKATSAGIYIDLSSEFSQGGGSSAMTGRVAQVLYTATSLNPVASVFLSIDGQPLDETNPLGGEGLVLAHPLTRDQFIKDFPPYLLK